MKNLAYLSPKPVKAYLLGQLAADEADRLEDRYFSDRSVFLSVQAIERDLIREYLRGKLEEPDFSAFESRYLSVPELRRRLEEVRQQVQSAPVTRPLLSQALWKPVLAATLASLLGIGMWLSLRPHSGVEHSTPALIGTSLVLSPGVTMGQGSTPRVLMLPSTPGPVTLVLDLPGQTGVVRCTVRLSEVLADGNWKQVWISSEPQSSAAVDGGQQVKFVIDSRILHAQDYVAEVIGADGNVMESYVFSGRLVR